MVEGPDRLHRLLSKPGEKRELDVLVVDDITLEQTLLIKTAGSMFILEPTTRTEWGGLRGNITRFAEAPMTNESSMTYLPDVMIVEEDCLLFDGSIINVGESMYFHDIHYAGQTYKDDSYDVIHTGPIETFTILEGVPSN